MNDPREHPAPPAGADRGALLLEVVLSLGILVAAASVWMGGLASSRSAVDRLRDEAVAADLAVSILSLVEMEVIPAAAARARPFEAPFEEWTWELVALDHGVWEAVVRNEPSRTVYRLAQFLRVEEPGKAESAREPSREGIERVRRIFGEEWERQRKLSEKESSRHES